MTWCYHNHSSLYKESFCNHPKHVKESYKRFLENKIREIIVDKLGIEESEITDSASFTNDLGADSLDTVELIMEFEKEFNVSIPDEEAEKIQTVGDAVTYLKDNVK